MKIREGAYYRTRDGDVVGPMRPGPSNIRFCWETGLSSWDATGAFSEDGEEHDLDLISEAYVSDTPPADTPAPETKTLRDEFAMVALSDFMSQFRENKVSQYAACGLSYDWADAMMEARKKCTPDEATALQARVAELEGALDFYACVDHYQIHNAAAPNVVQFDRGAKARAVLEGKKDEC